MNFEDKDFKSILNRMLEKVPLNIDKREGSVIYDALAPCAYELAFMYLELFNFLQESFAVTASREFLIKKGIEIGIEPHQATKTVLKGVFNINVPIGSRFNLDDLNFIVTEKITENEFKLECETAGTIGNTSIGDLVAIDYIDGLATAKLTEVLEFARDEEDTEDFRKRYFIKVREPATSGNIYHYKRWVTSVQGVGGVKVYPLWNGNGTVKVVIVDDKMSVASVDLVDKVKKHLEEVRPIGATVTVISARNKDINVNVKIRKNKVVNVELIKEQFEKALKKHIKDVSFHTNYLSIAKVGNILLSIEDVFDYTDLTLNNIKSNVDIADDEVPNIKSINIEVIE